MKIEILKEDDLNVQAYKNAILEEIEKDTLYKEAVDKCPESFEDLLKYLFLKAQEQADKEARGYHKFSGGAMCGSEWIMPITKEYFIDFDMRKKEAEEKKKKADEKKKAKEEAEANLTEADKKRLEAQNINRAKKGKAKKELHKVFSKQEKPENKGYEQTSLFDFI